MSGFEFIASLVASLSWPAVILAVALVFRQQLSKLLARPLSSLKAGPLEAVWDRQVAEVEAELSPSSPGTSSGRIVSRTDHLRDVARVAPAAAVLSAFAEIEKQLRQILTDAGVEPAYSGGTQMARLALENDLIQPETVKAIEGAAVLRNLAAHGREPDLDETRALEFLALADAVSYALDNGPRPA